VQNFFRSYKKHCSCCLGEFSIFIGVQNFFRSYKKLAGMTGTAETESSEFQNIYNLPVTVVPTNQKVRRTDESDVVFRTEEGTVIYWACISEACKVADWLTNQLTA